MIAAPQIDELKQAYELLDCPPSASPRAIKQSYRRMTKRWHPDHYQTGTAEHAEATQMMRRINEAYAQIANAPLRDHTEGSTTSWKRVATNPRTQPSSSQPHSHDTYLDNLPEMPPQFGHRIDFWTRFVLGALLGMAIVIRARFFFIFHSRGWPRMIGVLAIVTLVIGLALFSAQTVKKPGRGGYDRWWP